jgi:hypothetical protein
MYPITNEVKTLFESEQRKVLRITGTDKNGRNISITDDNVIADSFQVDRYSCNGEKLEIGTAIAAQLTLTLENGNGQYDSIAFEDAELFVEVGVADWTQSSPTIYWVPCGYFTPDEQPRRLSTISITALDRMMRFDAVPIKMIPWTTANGDVMKTASGETIYFIKSIRFPATIAQIVSQIAALCEVPFTQNLSGYPNYNATVTELPVTLESVTYRTIIQWCAGIMGCNAWIDWTGSLRFSWYTNATGYVSTTDNRYNSDLYENDLSITGVAYTNSSGVEFVEGTDEYTIDIIGNSLIGQQVASMLPNIATALNGFTYRPFTAAVVNAPYLWPMDIITFTDKDGNDHTSALTNVAFGLNGTTALESKGMTYVVNRGVKPNGFTKEQAQLVNEVRQSVTNLDNSLDQEGIFNRLTDNGEIQGLILYNGKLYLNAEYIQAGTLVANLLLASILSIGGANDGNGGLKIMDSDGNVIGTWDKNGISVSKGSITGGTINGATLTLGGSNNTSGTLIVKDSDGNTVATIDNQGVSVSKGNISGPMVSLGGVDNQSGVLKIYDSFGNQFGIFNNAGLALTTSLTGRPTIKVTKQTNLADEIVTIGGDGAPLDILVDWNGASPYLNNKHFTFGNTGMYIGNGNNEYSIFDVGSLEMGSGTGLSSPYIELEYTSGNVKINLSPDSGLVFFVNHSSKTIIDEENAYFPGYIRVGNTTQTQQYLGVPATDGTGAVNGNWNINISGNAGNVTGVVSTMHGGTGEELSQAPSLLVDLEESTADNVFQASPRPGVTGVLGITNGGLDANNYADARDNLDVYSKAEVDNLILTPETDVSIPSTGNSVYQLLVGLTADHELIRWNFSDSPDNMPPVDLEWETYDGAFRITNNGGTTAETIRPIFVLPTAKGIV